MSLVRVSAFSVSLDGFGTGEGQSAEAPFGHAGEQLHEWMFATRWGREMLGERGGSGGIDEERAGNRLPRIGQTGMLEQRFDRGKRTKQLWGGHGQILTSAS